MRKIYNQVLTTGNDNNIKPETVLELLEAVQQLYPFPLKNHLQFGSPATEIKSMIYLPWLWIHSDKGLTLETPAFNFSTVANLPHQLS